MKSNVRGASCSCPNRLSCSLTNGLPDEKKELCKLQKKTTGTVIDEGEAVGNPVEIRSCILFRVEL